MAEIYRLEFKDRKQLTWQVRISSEDYSGEYSYLVGQGVPLVFNFNNNSDFFADPIRETDVNINVFSTSDFMLASLYAVADLQFPVEIYQGENLFFRGYLRPRKYQEEYEPASYKVTLTAICGLELLKNYEFKDADGEYYNGRISEAEIIFEILSKIGFTDFYEFINIYDENMSSGTGSSPMDQLYIDADVFKDFTCYEVLEHILRKYNAVIQQVDGIFRIWRPADLVNTQIYGRYFSYPTLNSTVVLYPDQYIHRNDTHPSSPLRQVPGSVMMIEGALKSVKLRHDYGNKESWLDNWELSGDTYNSTSGTWDGWTTQGGGLNIITDYIKTEKDGVALPSSNVPSTYWIKQEFGSFAKTSVGDYIVFSFDYAFYSWNENTIEDVMVYIQVKDVANNKYLKGTSGSIAEWSDSPEFLQFYHDVLYGLSEWVTSKWIIHGLEADGPYEITLYGSFSIGSLNFVTAFKNIKFAIFSEEMANLKGWVMLPYFDKQWWHPLGGKMKQKLVYFPEKEQNVVGKEYEKTNDLSGENYEDDIILGDVTDSGIDNILEQFKGALAISAGSTLQQIAAMFVSNYYNDYLIGNVILSSDGYIIYFTSQYPGLDFSGSTSITNTSGDLTGTAETLTANDAGTKQVDEIELTGTSGTADITINGITRLATFQTSLHDTAIDFVATWYDDYLEEGVELSYSSNSIIATERYAQGGFSGTTTITNVSGDLDGDVSTTTEPEEGTARVDIITLSGTSGSADITCDGITKEIAFSEGLLITSSWNKRGETNNKPLIELIAEEIAYQYERPKQLLQLNILETAQSIGIKMIGNIQDDINLYNDNVRCFSINRGEFDVRNRKWSLDLFEIGTKALNPEETEQELIVIYGLLYNWYAVTDSREIAAEGWHVPDEDDWNTLFVYLGGSSVAGGKMKETGTTYWTTPNTDATNESAFNGRGGGIRTSGNFAFLQSVAFFWIYNEDLDFGEHCAILLYYDGGYIGTTSVDSDVDSTKRWGLSVRLVKDSTTLSDGEEGTYTGNDGKVYRTICIGTQEWLADNLCETKYRNGDDIPEVTDNTTWVSLTTGALCAYNNDWSNAYEYQEAEVTAPTADNMIVTVDNTYITVDSQ